MKYKIHIGLLLLLAGSGATVWADGNTLLLAPRTFSEYFTDNLREDTRESGLDQSCSELAAPALMDGVTDTSPTRGSASPCAREITTECLRQKPPAPAPLPH